MELSHAGIQETSVLRAAHVSPAATRAAEYAAEIIGHGAEPSAAIIAFAAQGVQVNRFAELEPRQSGLDAAQQSREHAACSNF